MSDLRSCYEQFGGNFDDALGRLMNERLVQKFVLKFLDDPSYDLLVKSMEEGDAPTAFRAAHTLKGVAQNLAFTALGESSSNLTEALRGADTVDAGLPLLEQVKTDYNAVVAAVKSLNLG